MSLLILRDRIGYKCVIVRYICWCYFYGVRQINYKSRLNIVNDLKINNNVKNLHTLVNDIKAKSGRYASYGQGYVIMPKKAKRARKIGW